ncbi:MAG: hypothetical protein FWC60_02360 [Firmicutes bacterium]|nr:hypothetical protein [Bacillota bacterium]
MSARFTRCSKFEVRYYATFVSTLAQARKVINRKRFLGEHERTVNNFTGRLDTEQ